MFSEEHKLHTTFVPVKSVQMMDHCDISSTVDNNWRRVILFSVLVSYVKRR
jgi:hypothetical protein